MPELLRLATAGSVDDGKSTLIGRLLYDAKGIFEDQLEAIRRTSEQRGGTETDLALLTDGLRAEREQGITIDVAYRYFATPKRKFIIADTPGHTEYTRNMVTGASNAHVALILIDARKGVIEQTRRHAFLSSMLGVPHMVVCVNKMDLIDWDQERYERIKSDFMEFAARLNVHDITFIPMSALRGDNVVQRSEHMWWYDGSPLLNHLESVYIGSDENFIDPRFPVQYVIRSQTPGEPGLPRLRGDGGQRRPPPGRRRAGHADRDDVAHRLHRDGGRRGRRGVPAHGRGHHTGRRHRRVPGRHPLPAQQPPDRVARHRGDGVLDGRALLAGRGTFLPAQAQHPDGAGHGADAALPPRHQRTAPRRGGAEPRAERGGRVTFRCTEPLLVDDYTTNRSTGSFIIIDPTTNATVGAGVIRVIATPTPARTWCATTGGCRGRTASPRWGRRGRRSCSPGLSGAGKSTVAAGVEEAFVRSGRPAFLIDGDNLRHGLNADLGFSDRDRTENVRRAGEVAAMFAEAGSLALIALICPFEEDRHLIRVLHEQAGLTFVEVFVDTSIEECERRDAKGLYARARAGQLPGFTGIDSAYEVPARPDLVLGPDAGSLPERISLVLGLLDDLLR